MPLLPWLRAGLETMGFVLACWEKKKERNKNKIFYLLNINYITFASYINMGPGQVGALGRCPSCPGLGPGLVIIKISTRGILGLTHAMV